MTRVLASVAFLLTLTACETCPSGVAYAPAAPMASPCAAPAAAPCAAPQEVQYVAPAPAYATAYGPAGFEEHAKAVLAVPPGVIICLAQGLHCALNALWPVPGPSMHLVPVQGVSYQMVQPAAAAPCAPRTQFVMPVLDPQRMAAPCR